MFQSTDLMAQHARMLNLLQAERLALLDLHAPFRHVLEHHFEREEKGLCVEVRG